MIKTIPILKLSNPEKLWLEHIYSIQKQNRRVNYKEVWSKLYNKLPHNFRPVAMDESLVDSAGEEVKLLGIIALEKNYSVLEKINVLINGIKKIILTDPLEENIKVSEITNVTHLSASEISFLFRLVKDFGGFWSSASYEQDSDVLKTIGVGRDSTVFYSYISFHKIEDLIISRLNQKKADEKLLSHKSEQQNKTVISTSYLSINPIFHSRPSKLNKKLCFVLMPFKEEWSQRVYRDLIRKNIEALGLQCLRADDLTGQNIVEDIWTGINQAALIIADVTNNNPNVMYELGIVHTLGKPSILITQNIESIPFDFRHLRHISYRENTEAIKSFKTQFKKYISDLYKEHYPGIELI